jgi:hypothetical protein
VGREGKVRVRAIVGAIQRKVRATLRDLRPELGLDLELELGLDLGLWSGSGLDRGANPALSRDRYQCERIELLKLFVVLS